MANDIKEFLDNHSLKDGIYFDYDFVNNKTSEVVSMASFFPYKFGLCDTNILNKEYFKIPLELNATQWAIDFAIANQSRMDKFNQVITKRRNG